MAARCVMIPEALAYQLHMLVLTFESSKLSISEAWRQELEGALQDCIMAPQPVLAHGNIGMSVPFVRRLHEMLAAFSVRLQEDLLACGPVNEMCQELMGAIAKTLNGKNVLLQGPQVVFDDHFEAMAPIVPVDVCPLCKCVFGQGVAMCPTCNVSTVVKYE